MLTKIAEISIIIWIFFCAIVLINAKPPKIKIKITNVELETDQNLLLMNATIHESKDVLVDVEATLIKDLGTNLYLQSIIYTKIGRADDYQVLIKSDRSNICAFFKEPTKEPVMKLLFENISKFGNLMSKCPVEKGYYYLKNFTLETRSLPSFTPTGKYKVEIELTRMENNIYLIVYKMAWYASVTKL